MAELTTQGRKYEIVETDNGYTNRVLGKRRCAIRIEYGHLSETHIAALRALQGAGRKDAECNFEVHLAVLCERCQKGLSPMGIGMLIMSQRSNMAGVAGLQSGQVSGQVCTSCGNRYCYLIFDPDGFPRPKTT
jgi:hypothetical protein